MNKNLTTAQAAALIIKQDGHCDSSDYTIMCRDCPVYQQGIPCNDANDPRRLEAVQRYIIEHQLEMFEVLI